MRITLDPGVDAVCSARATGHHWIYVVADTIAVGAALRLDVAAPIRDAHPGSRLAVGRYAGHGVATLPDGA